VSSFAESSRPFVEASSTPKPGLCGARFENLASQFPPSPWLPCSQELIATPEKHKRHVIFEAGHLPLPRAELIRETLGWLDRYQGPATR
jgi:hypothetical protein